MVTPKGSVMKSLSFLTIPQQGVLLGRMYCFSSSRRQTSEDGNPQIGVGVSVDNDHQRTPAQLLNSHFPQR
eukprot:scaffold3096_cov257-Chaetoceros_neogracile.AAC.1